MEVTEFLTFPNPVSIKSDFSQPGGLQSSVTDDFTEWDRTLSLFAAPSFHRSLSPQPRTHSRTHTSARTGWEARTGPSPNEETINHV